MIHRKLFKILALVMVSIILLAGLIFGAAKAWRHYEYTSVGDSGIVQTDAVTIRGTTQHLFIRGYDREKPLLLFLPGGPGESFVPLASEFSEELERDFVVVHIETGGVGKSDKYGKGPTLPQMVQDTNDIVDHLLSDFNRPALYLVGHSFGSILALNVAEASPEKVLGIATVGQAVDWRAGNLITYEHLMSLARREGNDQAIAALSSFTPRLATTANGQPTIDFSAVKEQRKWLEHFNIGNILQEHTATARWFTYMTSPNHTIAESCELVYAGPCKWIANPRWWSQWKNVIPGVLGFNAMRDVPELEVPYVAIVGSDDWITPKALTRQYYEVVASPQKRYIEIPGAQHYTFLDKPHEFQQAVRTLLLLNNKRSE
ncbi:MAG: alpha/beta hydrolase [Dokdonella sp.]|uniref:alpha/beta fold hydrolase n=1 Tax=Dokdonella sp. TaxID=2291710 RepID=UPI002B6B35EC|nr:alpha/beta hydrolase [Zoogloea sp.]